jgi:hypothetical protein
MTLQHSSEKLFMHKYKFEAPEAGAAEVPWKERAATGEDRQDDSKAHAMLFQSALFVTS